MLTPKVSILVPLYNEEEFIETLLERVMSAALPEGMDREIVVVDDASTDSSAALVENMAAKYPGSIFLFRHDRNQGKGAALRTAIDHARGEFTIIQDSDLEYDPKEYGKLLHPLLEGSADVVYGSRFMSSGERRVLYFWHSVANRFLTLLCNIAADVNLTDMETCYKAFRTPLLKSIPLRNDRFGFEPEITIKVARRQARIYETPISYHGRTYEEGKKIGFKDALEAVFLILRLVWTRDIYKEPGPQILDSFEAAKRFNRWMADTVRPYVGSDVMEIGAGIGNLTHALIPRRRRYVAADIDLESSARLRARFQHRPQLEIHRCDLADPTDFEPFAGTMDSVVCLNVLEHVEDDKTGLANIHSVLKPGGRAIILVPEGQQIFGTLDTVLGHYRRYSQEELRTKLQNAGFRVERILEFNRVSRPGWFVTGRILKRKTISRWSLSVFDRFVWVWRRVDGLLPWRPTSIIGIAVKTGDREVLAANEEADKEIGAFAESRN